MGNVNNINDYLKDARESMPVRETFKVEVYLYEDDLIDFKEAACDNGWMYFVIQLAET